MTDREKDRAAVENPTCAAGVLSGMIIAWIAALLEGLFLHWYGSGRGAAEWGYALILYGWFGFLCGFFWVAGLAALGKLSARFSRVSGAFLLPGLLLTTAVVVGGYWLNQWSRFPHAATAAGIVAQGGILLFAALGCLPAAGPSRAIAAAARSAAGRWKLVSAVFPGCGLILLTVTLIHIIPFAQKIKPTASPSKGPPVIMILVDTLRRDHLQCYGYPKPTSPNIDALAREGIQFINSNCGGCRTIPSTATLFTGIYPSTHKVMKHGSVISRSMETLAERFQSSGYRTAAFISNPYLRPANGFARGFDFFFPRRLPGLISSHKTAIELIALRLTNYNLTPEVDKVVPLAHRWLTESSSRPPFLYLHLMEPHSPYMPARKFSLPFLPPEVEKLYHVPPRIRDYLGGREWLSWDEIDPPPEVSSHKREVMTALYDGEIRYLDRWLGIFLEMLKSEGLYKNALVLFLTDHGEEFNDHGGWFHGRTLYEEMIGMPFILHLPGAERTGTISPLPIHAVDLLPTLSALAGLGVPAGAQGRDYSAEILGSGGAVGGAPTGGSSYLEEPPWLYSLQIDEWKVIEKNVEGQTDWKLFNMELDPSESRDLSAVQVDTLDSLVKLLSGLISDFARASENHIHLETDAPDPETRRLLKSLGYID